MPTLPRDPIPQQGVRNERVELRQLRADGSDPVGGALSQAGDAVHQFASNVRAANINAEVVDAELTLRDELDKTYRELEKDTTADPGSLEERFEKASQQVVERAGSKMSSDMHKRLWTEASRKSVDAYTFKTRDLSRQRYVENASAKTMGVITKFNELAADPSRPRTLLEHHYQETKGLIASQLEAGVWTVDKAKEVSIANEKTLKAGVSLRHTTLVEALMDAGQIKEANDYLDMVSEYDDTKVHKDEILPAERVRLDKISAVKTKEAEAVQTADAIMEKADNDYGAALIEARQIKDIDLRLDVVAHIGAMKNQNDVAEAVTEKADLEEGLGYVVRGESLPAGFLGRASPSVIDRLQTEQRTRKLWDQQMAALTAEERRAMKEISAASREHMISFGADPRLAPVYLQGPTAWKTVAPEMYEQYSSMESADQDGVIADINTRSAEGFTAPASDKVFLDLLQSVPVLQPPNAKGVKYGETRSTDANRSDEEKAVRRSLYNQAVNYSRETGGAPLTNEMRKAMVARAFRAADPSVYPYADGDRPANLAAQVREAVAMRGDLVEILGREPTQNEINQATQGLRK